MQISILHSYILENHFIIFKSNCLNYKIALFENTTRILIDWDNLSIPVKKCIRENLLTIKHLDLSIMGRMQLYFHQNTDPAGQIRLLTYLVRIKIITSILSWCLLVIAVYQEGLINNFFSVMIIDHSH